MTKGRSQAEVIQYIREHPEQAYEVIKELVVLEHRNPPKLMPWDNRSK